jgi:hypothetical protein
VPSTKRARVWSAPLDFVDFIKDVFASDTGAIGRNYVDDSPHRSRVLSAFLRSAEHPSPARFGHRVVDRGWAAGGRETMTTNDNR